MFCQSLDICFFIFPPLASLSQRSSNLHLLLLFFFFLLLVKIIYSNKPTKNLCENSFSLFFFVQLFSCALFFLFKFFAHALFFVQIFSLCSTFFFQFFFFQFFQLFFLFDHRIFLKNKKNSILPPGKHPLVILWWGPGVFQG